ncbi:uncharacterized protein LOC128191875 [Crassostrea angulata]|uniref:uncharacterized protein LOC128191875 n=1 Tax=Magallana angulata TaxID=2784310 RepID=UPI0022B09570|nr:uncharacterized protein LOC128191875 [Crassostrea angulata]
MSLLQRILLLVTSVAIIAAVSSQPLVENNVPTAQQSGNDLNFYLLEQVYAMKPKLQALEAKTKEMELDLAIKKEQIEALQNRKEFRCESGVVERYVDTKPLPSWPYTRRVTFQTPFEAKPTVTYGLYYLDSVSTTNLRVSAEVTNVFKTGFQVQLSTWADSQLYGAKIRWMACGK